MTTTPAPRPPSPWVVRHARLIRPGGRTLDVAAGGGRHTRHLLDAGFAVTALDIDTDRLADLDGQAGLEIVRADLEGADPWPLGERRFDAVVVTNYLHRPLFPRLLAALAPGGVLIYETFMAGNQRFGRPRSPDFLLQPGELLALCRPLSVIAFEQGLVERPAPAAIQRIVAERAEDAAALWPL